MGGHTEGLDEAVQVAKATWPDVDVPDDVFRERLLSAIAATETPADKLHASDLYLAAGCLARQHEALAALEKHVLAAVRPAVERACGKGTNADDILQITREKLVMGSTSSEPKLVQYTGKGPLAAWVRVVAVREALYAMRQTRRPASADDVALLADGSPRTTMEIALLRRTHAQHFREAVQEGLRRLTPEQRSLLRFHVCDGLTIDQLAPMLDVHRATAARRLEKARADALANTRAILRERHGLTESEAKSLCLALAGEVDVSIGRALAEATP